MNVTLVDLLTPNAAVKADSGGASNGGGMPGLFSSLLTAEQTTLLEGLVRDAQALANSTKQKVAVTLDGRVVSLSENVAAPEGALVLAPQRTTADPQAQFPGDALPVEPALAVKPSSDDETVPPDNQTEDVPEPEISSVPEKINGPPVHRAQPDVVLPEVALLHAVHSNGAPFVRAQAESSGEVVLEGDETLDTAKAEAVASVVPEEDGGETVPVDDQTEDGVVEAARVAPATTVEGAEEVLAGVVARTVAAPPETVEPLARVPNAHATAVSRLQEVDLPLQARGHHPVIGASGGQAAVAPAVLARGHAPVVLETPVTLGSNVAENAVVRPSVSAPASPVVVPASLEAEVTKHVPQVASQSREGEAAVVERVVPAAKSVAAPIRVETSLLHSAVGNSEASKAVATARSVLTLAGGGRSLAAPPQTEVTAPPVPATVARPPAVSPQPEAVSLPKAPLPPTAAAPQPAVVSPPSAPVPVAVALRPVPPPLVVKPAENAAAPIPVASVDEPEAPLPSIPRPAATVVHAARASVEPGPEPPVPVAKAAPQGQAKQAERATEVHAALREGLSPKPAAQPTLAPAVQPEAVEAAARASTVEARPASAPAIESAAVQARPEVVPSLAAPAEGVVQAASRGEVPRAEPAAQPKQSVTVSQVGQFTVRAVRHLFGNGEQTIQVRLIPESLGELHITVKSVDDTLEIALASSNQGVRQILEHQLHGLRETLAREGIDVSRAVVTTAASGGDADGQQASSTRNGNGQSGASHRHATHQPDGSAAEQRQHPLFKRSTHPGNVRDGRLNVFV